VSLFGMGTSTVSQVNAMRMQMRPPAQTQVYQQCQPPTHPQIIQLPGGGYQVQCVQVQP
jgi:hypothetical protein